MSLPSDFHILSLDEYITRIQEKIEFAQVGDVDKATTERSALTALKWNYITNEAPLIKEFFGFNSLVVVDGAASHNTYMDLILQFGFIGAITILFFVVIKYTSSVLQFVRGDDGEKYVVILKTLVLFFALTLSIFHGPVFAIVFVICIL
jgi:hypothetical protein